MKFSVIIPTKARPHLLERALRSILAQSNQDFEIIVVDDGNGEGIALANSLGHAQISAFSSQFAGQVGARHQAIARAKGVYLAWLDDDDWWEPCHLQEMAAALKLAPAAYASGWIASETESGARLSTLPFSAFANAQSLQSNNTLLWSGFAYPRDFHDKFGLFDTSMAYYWDWDWYLRLAEQGVAFQTTHRPSVWVSARQSNVSANANEAPRRAELDRLQAKHGLSPIPLKNHAGIAEEQAAVNMG